MLNDKELVNYLVETFQTTDRPQILTDGGIYIWDATQTRILAGPFENKQHAMDAKSKALDKAISKVNKQK